MPRLVCWVISEGRPGIENQCLGLAEALARTAPAGTGLEIVTKRIRIAPPWRWLPHRFWPEPLRCLGPQGDRLAPPWPDLLICAGRVSVAPSLAVKAASGGLCQAIRLERPYGSGAAFDLVVTPAHDRYEGSNVLHSSGALNRVRPDLLSAAAREFAALAESLPTPLTAVLIGGDSKAYRMTPESLRDLAAGLRAACEANGGGLLITGSRRTPPAAMAAFREAIGGLPHYLWDGSGANPYYGFLGLAETIVTTCDSVSMLSEACATGKPVYVHELPGRGGKLRAFLDRLYAENRARRFAGRLEHWRCEPLDDATAIARAIWLRQPGQPATVS
ncbi:mitochondrial fission ELM1 family protein [Oceanibacterium hippocampi]|uniref:Nucleoside-diphosphate sugar epimerase n=1 Tax=Oceanibacterium hippocampi TaxID=745714 RepID=A0A1Y5TVK1_9PROT|nr:mitochondrial fission ELM1 family protein [Oceanibacterium hippocampi]SLN74299.1 hypothetical protein OCH7691_03728 [Oceanibacterium hippocampi]